MILARSFWKDERVVSKTPLLTVFLLQGANVGQIARMWQEKSAEGQSLLAWFMVSAALVLWFNFYWHAMPRGSEGRRWALWGTGIGIGMNATVILSVLWFRIFYAL